MKKTLSILLAIVMCISCFSFAATTAYADEVTTVTFKGYEYNARAKEAIDIINEKRIGYGYPALTLDENLTNIARQRAKELFIYYDTVNDTLPTGNPMTYYVPDFDDNMITSIFGSIYSASPSSYDIANNLSSIMYSAASKYITAGIGVFTYDDKTVYYVLVSAYPAASVCLNNNDAAATAKVATLASNLDARFYGNPDKNYFRYNLSVMAYPKGYAYSIDITSQCKFKTSKSSVLKVKGTKAYPKKNGSVVLTATGPAGTIQFSHKVTEFNKVNVKNVKAKSPKKKQLKVTYAYSVSDAEGYEIQYSTSSKFTSKTTKKVTVKGKKSLSKTIKNLKSKKTYYVRVRAYINQGNSEKAYSSWSKTAKIKIK